MHLKKLVNLDCFSLGQYNVKVEIGQSGKPSEPQQGELTLFPYYIPPKPFDDTKPHKTRPAHISDSGTQYVSQSFMFRSYTEGVELSDRVERHDHVQVSKTVVSSAMEC